MEENTESLGTDPVKFIIMDSQCESEDPDLMHLPALQMTQAKKSRTKEKQASLFKDTTDEDQTKQNVRVLVSDSEYDSAYKTTKKGNSSSDSIIVVESEDPSVVESEDQMETTVIKADYNIDSGSSFASNSKQDLGKYTTAEISHSQDSKVRGHLFPETVDSSELDLFKADEDDKASTPAEHIGSLQLSAQPMLVPETVDEEVYAVSPSQDNFPHVIPGSPTLEEENSYNPNAEPTLSDPHTDFNVTVMKTVSQKSGNTETQESFHLHLSCTEKNVSQKKGSNESSVLDRSDDVIVISQSEDQDVRESQELILQLSQTQSSQNVKGVPEGSEDTESLKGSEGFQMKLPPEEASQSKERNKVTLQGEQSLETVLPSQTGNQSSQQRSSQAKVDEADMVTQTPIVQITKDSDRNLDNTVRSPMKPNPSLTIGMITTQSQSSEHMFHLIRPEVSIGSEQYQSEDTSIFSKVKSTDKSSSRYVLHDDSDEEICFKTPNISCKKTEEGRVEQPLKLKMSRTMSSEATSTGYQGSVESLPSSVVQGDQLGKGETMEAEEGGITLQVVGDRRSSVNYRSSTLDTDTQSYDVEHYVRTAEVGKLTEKEKEKCEIHSKGGTEDNETKESSQNNFEKEDNREAGRRLSKDIEPVSMETDDVSKLTEVENQEVHVLQSSLQDVAESSETKSVVVKPITGFRIKNVNSRDQKQTSKQQDPYEFHGTQSQQENITGETNPVDHYRQVPPNPVETPPSSRKRKRKVHTKTGLKAARNTKPKQPVTSGHHVYFSSPVSEVLTTPPSCVVKTQNTASTMHSNMSPDVRSVPTRVGQVMSSTFSPPRDRIEEDFPNFTTSTTLHRQPISTPNQQKTNMGPPTPVSSVTTTMDSPSTSMLTRTETLAIPSDSQVESHQDIQDDVRIKTVTTTIVTFKVVETIEKMRFKSGAVKILSQHTERIPIKTHQKRTETTEEYVQSSVSPSRTSSTLTSGDLGDISSSLSRSGSSGPSSFDVNRMGSEIPVTQSSDSGHRRSLDPVIPSPKDQTYSPLEVSSIHKDTDLRFSSENLFTSPDTSKEEVRRRESTEGRKDWGERLSSDHITPDKHKENDMRAQESMSDGITCAQRKVVTPVQRSGEESDPVFSLPKPTTTESSGEDKVSPQIPYQDQAVSTTKPDTKTDNLRERVVGARVMAKWKDTHFYPGVIEDDIGKSRFKVRFDDGDIMVVKGHDVLLIDKLPIGQTVMVLSKDGYFYPGIITGESKRGEVIQYSVDQDNGVAGRYRYSQVILSEDQASCLIADMQCQLTQPTEETEDAIVKNADVSLENLIVGKRRKESRYEQLNTSTDERVASPSSSRRGRKLDEAAGTSGSNKRGHKTEQIDEAGPSKRGKSSFSPTPVKRATGPATSTPRVAKRRKISDEPTQLSTSPTSDDTTLNTRRSPRKGPAKSTKLFQGMYFLLTHVKKTAAVLAMEREILQGSCRDTSNEESGVEEDEEVPFEKELLKNAIIKEGGCILDKIDAHRKSKSMVYLVSSGYVRTIKYFQTLAAGYPCVSHQWILHSVHQNKLLDYKSYMLQAGISVLKGKVVEWNVHQGDLKDMVVMIESQIDRMKDEWTNILEIAGAKVVSKLHSKKTTDGQVQVLVTDSTCKSVTLRTARSLCVPVVSTEWVIQCLVNGHLMDFTGHPRYKYDFAVV